MISHFAGNPQGPSLSFFFSCGPDEAAGAAAGAAAVVDVLFVFVFCVVSVTTAFFSLSPPSSHGCALATAS